MVPRFFCPPPLALGALGTLPETSAHHAKRVLRLEPGDDVVLFDGRGGQYAGKIEFRGAQVRVRVLAHSAVEREAPLEIVLAQSVASGERMDWLVGKAVELGVARIVPLQSERCVVRLSEERAARRQRHWRQIVENACEQCGRNRLPEIGPVIGLRRFLAESAQASQARVLLDPQAASGLAALEPGPPPGVVLLAGPEGGFTDEERLAALACGFLGVRLGARVLRAETAGLAASAALLARWGDY